MKTQMNLDDIRIASPCNARWEDMAGDERARFCGGCSKNVFNLSAMTRPEIESLIRRTEGKFCGRFYQRPDGRMLTADCPTGGRRRRNRLTRWCGSAFVSVLMFFGARASLSAKESNEPSALMGTPMLMGDVAVPPKMGKIAAPVTPPTVKTNALVVPPREIMGRIFAPASGNSTNQEGELSVNASGQSAAAIQPAFNLTPPEFTNGAWRIRVAGPKVRGVRVQRSTDLSKWTDVATNATDDLGNVTMQVPPTGAATSFYRAVAP